MYNSITPRRTSARLLFWVTTFKPSATGVVQDAGMPRPPSIWTTQSRQEPKGSMLSVAHNLGISMPILAAARMMDVPTGAVTLKPSISRVTNWVAVLAGVPKSCCLLMLMNHSSCRYQAAPAFSSIPKSSGKLFKALNTG